jgi:putative transposase
VKYQFIAQPQEEFPVSRACQVLAVSPSGYDAWKKRGDSRRAQEDRWMMQQIHRIFQAGRGVYGIPRVHAILQQQGLLCSRKRVLRLMRQSGLIALRKRHKTRTSDSHHPHPVAPNLLQRNFVAQRPNEKWVGDITGIWTQQGWLYLAGIVDGYSRLIVGWVMNATRDEIVVEQALHMALQRRHPDAGLLHHPDRGSQYTSAAYRALLAECGITLRKGDCWDNALMESVWATLTGKGTDRHIFVSLQEARSVVFAYLGVFYNRQRIHSSLGYHRPAHFEHLMVSSDSFKTPLKRIMSNKRLEGHNEDPFLYMKRFSK